MLWVRGGGFGVWGLGFGRGGILDRTVCKPQTLNPKPLKP